jgi:hypothetical protein
LNIIWFIIKSGEFIEKAKKEYRSKFVLLR